MLDQAHFPTHPEQSPRGQMQLQYSNQQRHNKSLWHQDGIFTWHNLVIPIVSIEHWIEQVINAFIIHNKQTSDSSSFDSSAAPVNADAKQNATSNANATVICSILSPYCKNNPAP